LRTFRKNVMSAIRTWIICAYGSRRTATTPIKWAELAELYLNSQRRSGRTSIRNIGKPCACSAGSPR
jgi:hypothetical protein